MSWTIFWTVSLWYREIKYSDWLFQVPWLFLTNQSALFKHPLVNVYKIGQLKRLNRSNLMSPRPIRIFWWKILLEMHLQHWQHLPLLVLLLPSLKIISAVCKAKTERNYRVSARFASARLVHRIDFARASDTEAKVHRSAPNGNSFQFQEIQLFNENYLTNPISCKNILGIKQTNVTWSHECYWASN